METRIVRIHGKDHQALSELAKETGQTMTATLSNAIRALRRQRVLEQTNLAYEALRRDQAAASAEVAERETWDATLADGLEDS